MDAATRAARIIEHTAKQNTETHSIDDACLQDIWNKWLNMDPEKQFSEKGDDHKLGYVGQKIHVYLTYKCSPAALGLFRRLL
jgi:hypothetical protein